MVLITHQPRGRTLSALSITLCTAAIPLEKMALKIILDGSCTDALCGHVGCIIVGANASKCRQIIL